MNKPVPTDRQSRPAFLGDLLDTLTERGRNLLRRREPEAPVAAPDLATLGDLLLSRRGEASGVALARALVAAFDAAAPEERRAFLALLAERFGPDRAAVEAAIAAMQARRARRDRDAARRLRAAAAGAAATPQPRARRDRGAGQDARGAPEAPARASGAAPARLRLRASLRLVVQPRLPGAAPHRLDDAGEHPREDHPLRGGARHPELGRPPQPARADRPALLRLLPPAARRRAADLRRGGADRGDPRQRRRPARPRPRADRGGEGDDGGVLLDLQHPEGPRRRLLRQLPHQAGGRGPEGGAAEREDLRHPLAGAGLRRLAEARAGGRGVGDPRRRGRGRRSRFSTSPAGTSTRRRRKPCAPC